MRKVVPHLIPHRYKFYLRFYSMVRNLFGRIYLNQIEKY
jgi:hypothetical protein